MASKLVEEIGKMSVMDLVNLVKEIEEEFGVSAAAPVAVAAPGAAAAPAAGAAEEKTEFKVTLKDSGSEKIKVIKALRTVVSGLSLKDAKEKVDGAPSVLAESASKEDADKMKKALEEAGATVELA